MIAIVRFVLLAVMAAAASILLILILAGRPQQCPAYPGVVETLFLGCARAGEATTPTEFVIRITPQEAVQIGLALGERPFKDVAPLLRKLQSQIEEQEKAEKKP